MGTVISDPSAIPGVDRLKDSPVFVTGATSALGADVGRLLAANGARVIALVRHDSDAARLPRGTEAVTGDCTQPADYRDTLSACRFVVHIAGLRFASALIEACKPNDALVRVLFVGSTRVHYPDVMLSPRERDMKAMLIRQEDAVKASTLPWTLIRPTLIFSAQDRSLSRIERRIRRGRIVPLPGSGRAVKQPISSADLAVSAVKALVSPETLRKQYDVPGADISVYDLVVTMSRVLGRRPTLLRVPRFPLLAAKSVAARVGMQRHTALLTTYLRWYEDLRFSGTEARHDFGHSPREFGISFAELVGEANRDQV